MPSPTLRTLVFVAEGTIDIGLHCQAGYGFQLALDGDRLLQRKGVDSLNAAVAMIAKQADPFVLFLGAGFSYSSRMPLGNDMRDRAIRRLLSIPVQEPMTSKRL